MSNYITKIQYAWLKYTMLAWNTQVDFKYNTLALSTTSKLKV